MSAAVMESALSYYAARTLSRKTGVLKGLRLLLRGSDEAPVYTGIGELPDTGRIFSAKGEVSGTGVGATPSRTLMAAMGESLEGYSSYEVARPIRSASYSQLASEGLEAVSPQDLPLYSQRQYSVPGFPFAPFTENVKIGWVQGHSLTHGKAKFVPASQVYISYKPGEGERRICHTIFGGVACGISYKRTLLSGVYEAIERDSMMIWWLNQLPMEKVSFERKTECRALGEQLTAGGGFRLETWRISVNLGVSVFFSLLTDCRNKAISGGFGTNLNPQIACLKSLYECVQNRLGQLPMRHSWGRELYNNKIGFSVLGGVENDLSLDELIEKFSRSTNLYANLQFYLYPQTHSCLGAIRAYDRLAELGEMENLSCGSPEGDLDKCLDLLAAQGFEVIVTDLTMEDIAELGFVNLRVSIPGLVPNSVCAWPHLGNNRLYDVPAALGFTRKTEGEMSRLPIPYA